MTSLVFLLALIFISGIFALEDEILIDVRGWVLRDANDDFPETALDSILEKDSIGIAFSGGGARSYTASIGYLAGLHKLGILENVRYVTGVSGGAWATGAYSYQQITDDDDLFLGEITPPENITLDVLKTSIPECGRTKFAESDFAGYIAEHFLIHLPWDFAEAWTYAVEKVLLAPLGIVGTKLPVLDEVAARSYVNRYPDLYNLTDFIWPNRPSSAFPVIGITLVSPSDGILRTPSQNSYTLLEATPYYIGEAFSMNLSYPKNWYQVEYVNVTVGGLVEHIGFGGGQPLVGLDGASFKILNVPKPESLFSINKWLGASSYCPGAVFSGIPVVKRLDFLVPYWSPSEKNPTSFSMVLGDGGSVVGPPLIGLLRRRVAHIVVFANFQLPLATRENWNPNEREPTNDEMDGSLSSFFGIGEGIPAFDAWDTSRNQVFDKSDFAPLVIAMQDSALAGKGAMVSKDLITIENTWWGIPAGIKARVTFVYLSRYLNWEKRLPDEVRNHIYKDGSKEESDPSVGARSGLLHNFPYYDTLTQISPTLTQANLLAEMCGSMIIDNKALFRSAFGLEQDSKDNEDYYKSSM